MQHGKKIKYGQSSIVVEMAAHDDNTDDLQCANAEPTGDYNGSCSIEADSRLFCNHWVILRPACTGTISATSPFR